jgi:hypothetical protein
MGMLDSRKLTFSFINAVLFLVIASPPVYRIVGSIFGLSYDGEDNNRISLLFIHTVVFMLVTLIAVNVYSPGA